MKKQRACLNCDRRYLSECRVTKDKGYCSKECEVLHKNKLSNQRWANTDYKEKMAKQAKRNRKINPIALWGMSDGVPAPGLKRFNVMRG